MIYVIYDVVTFEIAEYCFSEDEVLDVFKKHYFGLIDSSGQCCYNWRAIDICEILKSL